jgi:hypothetical protein
LFFTFLCPSYNLADYEQTWFERGGEVPRRIKGKKRLLVGAKPAAAR